MVNSRVRLLKIAISLILLAGTLSGVSAQSRLRNWICRVLGINVQTYDRLSQARAGGEYQPILGMRLMRVKLPEEEETLVWQCDGCWSPVVVSETEATVLKQGGIWLVSLTENSTMPQRPKIAAQNIVAIIGPIGNQPKQLLIAQRTSAPRCEYTLRQVDLNTGRINDLDETAVKCLEGPNQLFLSVNAGRLRSDKLLISLTNTSGTPRTLWKQIFNPNPRADSLNVTERLIPRTDNNDDGVDRFDPNWINDNEVIYVADP